MKQQTLKRILTLALTTFTLSVHAQVVDPAFFPAVGRAVENKSTGEKIDLACLETPAEGQTCTHFQLRYTDKNGSTSLIGSEVMMKTVPEEQFQKMVADTNKKYHHDKIWKMNAFPIAKIGAKNDLASLPYVIGGVILFMDSIMILTDDVAAISTIEMAAIAAGLSVPAIDIIITVAPLLAIGTQRGVLKIAEKVRTKKFKEAVHTMFDDAETTETSYLLKNKKFNLLKNNLLANMN